MKPPDPRQWDGVTEDSLFLNEGLLRIADLITVPPEICSTDSGSALNWDVETSAELSSQDLAKQIERMYCYKSSSYQRFQDYRLCALKGFWESLKSVQDLEPAVSAMTTALKSQNPTTLPFTSRVSLLLIFPLLQVQSKSNPELCKTTTQLLIDCLKDCKPLSLANEPQDCLDGLENLLCSWINDNNIVQSKDDKAILASTLVTLACARGSVRMMISTIHTVQKLQCGELNVGRMLSELLETSGGPGVPTALNGNLHHLCWDHSDVISVPADINSNNNNKCKEVPRSIGTDGKYLYLTGCTGAGLARIGTGRSGTLRGVVYTRNLHMEQGWVTYADGHLIFRQATYDNKSTSPFCQIVNTSTLEVESEININWDIERGGGSTTTTLAVCSDGLYIYWVTCSSVIIKSSSSKSNKSLTIFVDVLKFETNEESGLLELVPVKDRVTIQRRDIEVNKTLTEALIEKLRPVRSGSGHLALEAIQLLAATAKDDNAQTSSGLTLKMLRRTPMYTCGNHLVMIIPTSGNSRPGAAGGQPSALFVPALSVAPPSSAKAGIATSLCFELTEGQLDQRVDLTDAPGCALFKGSSLTSMGACYDVENNIIWTCSEEWVEEWGNPGNLAPHHIAKRLGVVPTPLPDTLVSMNTVVTILLHHLGSSCCHQQQTETEHNVPETTPEYLSQLSDILHSSLRNHGNTELGNNDNMEPGNHGNEQQLHCVLVLLNHSMNRLEQLTPELETSVSSLRDQVWNILSGQYSEAILKAASRVLSNSFEVFYRSECAQLDMVVELIRASQHTGCQILQTSVFSHICAQLDTNLAVEKSAWCSMYIVEAVFDAIIAESCELVSSVVTLGNEEFKTMLSHMPKRSPSMSLMASIQSYLFRYSLAQSQKSENKEIITQLFNYVKFALQKCRQVYERVLWVVTGLDELETVHVEIRLIMFERLIKSSVLGLILPPMLCLLCDRKLHTMYFSESLLQMFSEVGVLACQAATAIHDQMKLLLSSDVMIEDQGGVEQSDQYDEYLSSLSVPAPWAAGRSVESVHPVRDNYKFKDTVTIPGARCLYLRFDPRCATQYDYDKVIIYAGPSTSSRKVAEYGGNTYGFGSRSVLGTGWPTDHVKVEGHTVTFSFEMRSGREHNTPDRAIWGFACSVRAQESGEEDMLGMAVLADTALGLSTLACHALRVLYEGPPPSQEELACKDLMESKLLQKCVWKEGSTHLQNTKTSTVESNHGNTKLVEQLRILTGKPGPTFRPSLKEIVKPQQIESMVIAAAIKHLQLELDPDSEDGTKNLPASTLSVVNKVLIRLNSMLRKIQNLAELEQRWYNEQDDVISGTLTPGEVFFASFHLVENKLWELELLCIVTNVTYDSENPEDTVKQLIKLISEPAKQEPMSKTKWVLGQLRERLAVLSSVDVRADPVFSRTTSLAANHLQPALSTDTDIEFNRSFSAPSILAPDKTREPESAATRDPAHLAQSLHKLRRKHKKTSGHKSGDKGYNMAASDEETSGPVEELFRFIGSEPDKAISCETFLSAAKLRHARGKARSKALQLMYQLLIKADQAKSVTHLVQDITSMLRGGPRCDELYCGGMTQEVLAKFSVTLQLLVKLTASHLSQCSETVALICIIPFSRTDDTCLLTSGLLKLIDTLLAGSTGSNHDKEAQQQISSVAWAGFRVLAHRCTSWEREDQTWEISALASQVAMVLTNHLARAIDTAGTQDTSGNDILHNVLSLLLDLSKTRLGQAIISQAVCISHLLYLLVDQRPSPKLVLTVLQLLRLALPLLSANQCSLVCLPTTVQGNCPATNIIHLLVNKLGEYLVPGAPDSTIKLCPPQVSTISETQRPGDNPDPQGQILSFNQRVTVYIHKRTNQQPHEVIQPLISADTRLFSQTTYMEKIIQMDRAMSQSGKAELLTDEFRVCARKAAKWAAAGFIISIEPPSAEDGQGEQRHLNTEHLCYEKNKDILHNEPVRPFISGQVASSLASKVISLLHALLTTSSNVLWTKAIEQVLGSSLSKGSDLIRDLQNVVVSASSMSICVLLRTSRQLMAVLAALGGFKEYIRTGSQVQIKGELITEGVVTALSERQGVASVMLDSGVEMSCPIARLLPPRKEVLPIDSLDITAQLVELLHMFIKLNLPPEPTTGDASSLPHIACRILAELKTRAFMVLSLEVRDPGFADEFLSYNNEITETMSSIAHNCTSGSRLAVVEALCEHLRMVYHDCAHPPPPPPPKKQPQSIQMKWESNCDYPMVRGTIFSQNGTCLHFLSDVTPPPGQPKGVMIYANSRIPSSQSSFYYEIQLFASGDAPDEQGGNIVSFGFAPPPPTNSTTSWTNPSGTVLFHSNGRAYHYCGPTILAWKSVRLNCSVKVGDTAGIGWTQANPAVGTVYFTLNGQVLQGEQSDVPAGLFPVIHIHRKGTRVRANFGTQPFKYTPCDTPECSTPAVSPASSEERLSEILPIGVLSGTDLSEDDSGAEVGGSLGSRSGAGVPVHEAAQQLPLPDYNTSISLKSKLPPSYTYLIETGPNTKGSVVDDEEAVQDEDIEEQRQDHYALLVRAWEAKVFPVIRRRFRNEQERRSGLEQIKGALLLGMTEIACQTVDFLYEDNGGRPKDLTLPTLDDIKEDLAKFTIDRLRTGMTVVIKPDESQKFSVRGMHYTYGLHGIVHAVDYPNELVQVETYLRQEGILVRYWYPLSILERPLHHQMSATSTCNVDVKDCVVHRQMLFHEEILANLYCRSALLAFVENPRPFFKLPRQLSSRATSHTTSPAEDGESCSSSAVSLPFTGSITADCLEPPNTEYVNMLSKELLRGPQPNGTVPPLTESCAPSSASVLEYNPLSASRLFYSNSARLKEALFKMINNANNEECSLMSLSARFLKILNEAPQKFCLETVRLADSKTSYDVRFQNAAFIHVTCRITGLDEKSSDNYPKCPWVRVFAHNGTQGLARDGQPLRQEVVHYPYNSTTYSTAYQEPTAVSVQGIARFPTVMIPFDRVHVRTISSSPSPPVQICLHSIPAEFCLAMTYIETLIDLGNKTCITCPIPILLYCCEALCRTLYRVDLPHPAKEVMFHSLAELMRLVPPTTPALVTLSTKLKPFQVELFSLFSHELKANGCSKRKEITSLRDLRISTYFQSLVEVVFALRELLPDSCSRHTEEDDPSPSTCKSSSTVKRTKSADRQTQLTKRRKIRTKQRGRESAKSPPGEPELESVVAVPWLDMAVTCNLILRNVVDSYPRGAEGVKQSLTQLKESLCLTHCTSRLIVICGLPTFYSTERVKSAIKKVCLTYGDIVQDELFVPCHEFPQPPSKDQNEALCKGVAVLQLNSQEKVKEVIEVLQDNKFLKGDVSGKTADNNRAYCAVTLTPELLCSSDNSALIASAVELYCTNKLLTNQTQLTEPTKEVLQHIFLSCTGKSPVSKVSCSVVQEQNLLYQAITIYDTEDHLATINTIFKEYGEKLSDESDELYLTMENFQEWVCQQAHSRPLHVLRSILATGYDLQYNLISPVDPDYLTKLSKYCTKEVDRTIVKYVNNLCRSRGVSSSRIFAQEILFSVSDKSNPTYAVLVNMPLEYVRLRFAFLQVINTSVLKHLLPAVNLSTIRIYPHSIGAVLLRSRDYLFYDVKLAYLHSVINSTDRRSGDSVPPEILFDPLMFVQQADRDKTVSMLAKEQLNRTPSAELCVKLASGGDPVFPFNVKLTGETVQGTSGSFRYFMWLVAQELQSATLPVLLECPSASAGENKGKFLLAPKNLDYQDEAMLQFLGVLLGIAMRSDVPFAIDCLRPFWCRLLNEEVDFDEDLAKSDIITHNFLGGLKRIKSEDEYVSMVTKTCPTHFGAEGCSPSCPYKFSYASLDGSDISLKAGSPPILWNNLSQFIEEVRGLRKVELQTDNIIPVIQCGLASIVPIEPLCLLGPGDLELRTCGQQEIEIGFIKLHTIYQVGISQTDKHIEFFWNVVESLTQEDLRKLIKFACNQERIPFSCPCQEGGPDASHVPPYPMKIAPAEGRDDRLIRTETCMFMIKLPQYSSEVIMRERILQAINCRDDPLSG